MKGFIFYVEFPTATAKRKATRKNLTGHIGNCIAVTSDKKEQLEQWRVNRCYPAVINVFNHSNSECCYDYVHVDYLAERCKRISEVQAREIHPNLFYSIEQ
jgi:hypothetical protein